MNLNRGHNFGGAKAQMLRARLRQLTERNRLDQFAALLAEHDADSGWEGGNVRECAEAMGLDSAAGNAMLQRIRQRLGLQAR